MPDQTLSSMKPILSVHVATLRRALGDCQAGRRYITNVPGRGYSFVAASPPTKRRQRAVAPRKEERIRWAAPRRKPAADGARFLQH